MAVCEKCGGKYRMNWVRMQPCPACRGAGDKMAGPVTKYLIKARVARLVKEGMPISIDDAYGQIRIESKDGQRALSPRMTTGHLMEWLIAYEEGWKASRVALLDEKWRLEQAVGR